MRHDVWYAVRNLRRHPLLAVVAALTLGIGIGGATAVFSVVDAVLLRPLPFPEPDRLVRLYEVTPDGAPFSISPTTFLDLADSGTTLERIAAYRETGTMMVLETEAEPQRIAVVAVSASFTDVLKVSPAIGRFFGADDDRPRTAARAVVLSDTLWRSRFGADRSVLGKTVRLDGESFTIVGVMPHGFDFPGGMDAWVPLRADPQTDRDDKNLGAIGRLAPGMSLAALRSELRVFGARLSDEYPAANRGWSFGATSFDEWLVTPRFRDAVWVLFAAVGVLLLLACANVANLLVAHGAAREAELRIRAALGAGRSRIVQQLLIESGVLGVLGTMAGLFVAAWSIAGVHALGGDRLPRLDEVGVDAVVLAFAGVAGMVSCVVAGVAPAFHASRIDLRTGLESGARHTGGGRMLRHTLVVVEVALALLLLVGAGLLANSFVRLLRNDAGFDPAGVLAMTIDVPASRGADDRPARFYGELLEQVRTLPGVTSAGASSTSPFRQFGFSNNVTPEDRAASAPPSGLVQAGWRSVTPGFFETLGVPIVAGRAFDERDRDETERVVVVSQSLARQLWPDGHAVGRRVYWGGTTGRTRTVVGVTADFQDVQLGAAAGPVLFVPHAQVDLPTMTVLVRTPLDPGSIAPALRDVVRAMDAALPPPDVQAVAASRSAAAAGPRFNTALLGAFACLAFVLAVTGVYAMLAFTAIERRRELAVRMALGASGHEIVRLLLTRGLALTGTGTVLGLALAVALTRALQSMLFEVAPTDLWTFLSASLALLAAATIACYLPARRAARVDPLSVLSGR
ncbi:MAG TPA: ABC transporter permease [Vicinamibacterales bacterium]|nr:ABC transporter permease [Vicinamibacterales bacterium]